MSQQLPLRSPIASSSEGTGLDNMDSRSFLGRRFDGIRMRNRASDSPDRARGPLGLNLLHQAAEPLIDLVFVHGLRGGSIKTWRLGDDPRLFWPQHWLSSDSNFQNASIHSFGYNSDWGDVKDNILNIHDFGIALLGEMRNSPHLRRNSTNPIIMIGHSMGGLVIKKAYILARQDTSNPEFGQRVRCLFFLATPHRGSDSAQLLNNILKASGVLSSRSYITDIQRHSTSTQTINDHFRFYADDISLYSFCESLGTTIGLSSSVLVEKDSAFLGYKHEKFYYLNANHREVCKYKHPYDPNYIVVRNALASAIDDILRGEHVLKVEKNRSQMRTLKAYLDVSETPDDEVATQEEVKIPGSCQWLEEREEFQDWRDIFEDKLDDKHDHTPTCYWMSARPGAGKSVLAGHVVAHLQYFKLDCAYYFFHHGNKARQVLSGLLRSLAYQMALKNAGIREKLLRLEEDGVLFDKDDERAIWRKIFVAGIFQAKVYRPQYWVIDALDECVKYPEFFTLLSKLEALFPLRVFVTSRQVPEIQSIFLRLGDKVIVSEIRLEDTMKDIELYIQNRMETLPVDDPDERRELASRVLARSGGCFLWVRLVLAELEMVYSNTNIWNVLDGIPEGMIPFYQRTVEIMSKNHREKEIAKAILLWTVCAIRPLRTSELQQALELDIGVNILSITKSIAGLCGQLVHVDRNDTVQLVHPTARDFLTNEISDFAIKKHTGHERLAQACLKFLSGDEMKPPRNRRFLSSPRKEASDFRDYACVAFSDHAFSAHSEVDDLLISLDLFLKTNILSWVEHFAQKGSLYYLIRTAKNLKGYLERRAKYLSPLGSQVERVSSWATDLTRLVAKFGAPLLIAPSSIYFLVPPLCPLGSAIFSQFAKSPDGLVLTGVQNKQWEDCISFIDFNGRFATFVTCGEQVFAVGMETGEIELYNQRSCQWERTIHHQEPIDILQFDTSGKLLASSGSRSIKLWTVSGNEIWAQKLLSPCIELVFETISLVGVSMSGHITTWNIKSGALLNDQTYRYQLPQSQSTKSSSKAPFTASLSPDLEMVAFGYRSPHVCLFRLQDHEFLGHCTFSANGTSYDLPVVAVLFNLNPNVSLLAISYIDGTVAIFDPWSQEQLQSTDAGTARQAISSMACSPDGRTLATADSRGTMQIWDFETLTLLYRVQSSDFGFRLVSFSSYGIRIVDVMDSRLKVWEPAVLIRKTIEEDVSVSDAAILPATEGQDESNRTLRMTVMVPHPMLQLVFVGKYNGTVAVNNSKNGQEDLVLYSHGMEVFVTALAVNINNMLASGDVYGKVQVWQLEITARRTLKPRSLILNVSVAKAIKQLLLCPKGEHLLISTADSDSVFTVPKGKCVGKIVFTPTERTVWKWLLGTSPELLLIVDNKIQRHTWKGFPNLSNTQSITLSKDRELAAKDTKIRSAALHSESQHIIVDFYKDSGHVSTSTLLILDFNSLSSEQPESTLMLVPSPMFQKIHERVKYFLGIAKGRIIFIDNESWLSSVELGTFKGVRYTRHFFVPSEFVERETGILPVFTRDDDVVFATVGQLAVVKNGMKFQLGVALE